MVWGPFIRMSMLLEAASRVATSVDLLLFAAEDMVGVFQTELIAASIERAWGIKVNVILAVRERSRQTLGDKLRGLSDIHMHPDYGRAGGPEQVAAVLAAIRKDTDLVIAQRLEAALSVAGCEAGGLPSVMDIDDIEYVSHARRTRQQPWSLAKALGMVRQASIKRGELETIDAFATAFVCSTTDRDWLMQGGGVDARIDVIPNAMQFCGRTTGPGSRPRTIVYFGSYAYQPNVDAAEELINDIFPRVLVKCPNAQLLIVGAFAEKLPSFGTARPSVKIAGFVRDVAEVYGQAALACCPIRAGSGTRIKIIEASVWKIPTVATALAAEGLDLDDGTEVLIAEDAERIAAHCVSLLEDPLRAAAIGEAAWTKARKSFDRVVVVERIGAVYLETAARTRPGRLPPARHQTRT